MDYRAIAMMELRHEELNEEVDMDAIEWEMAERDREERYGEAEELE